MSDFAKNLFGFGKTRPAPNIPQSVQLKSNQQSEVENSENLYSSKGFPSSLLSRATPTIGINQDSYAMGTTIREQSTLNKSMTHFDNVQPSNLTVQIADNSTVDENTQPEKPSYTKNYDYSITNAIPTHESDTAVPRGKLRVTIIEAQGLSVNSQYAQPYVVCTFESSEVVTHGPESYDHKRNSIHKGVNDVYKQKLNQGTNHHPSNPVWQHTAIFDVIGANSALQIAVYDTVQDDHFLGQLQISPRTIEDSTSDKWFDLQPRLPTEPISGKVRIKFEYTSINKRHYGPEDFEILRLLGKGTFGQVFQVKKKDTQRIYAMKVLSKKVIVKKKEIAHTIGERNILVRTANTESPFIVGLKFSFQTPADLYLVTDFMSGGELFWHLQKEGRFSEDRAKFYIAELVLALEHLHDNDIVYRDLKPENILLDANGHIALCDFGLSKANLSGNGTTNTFCGTTEYLAPEVLLDESGYTKMVDFWSLGVLIFEMCCGWSPFYADNTQQMYKNIAFGKVRFPKEVLSAEGRSFVKGLLNRNPKHRLGAFNDARELRAHPFFHDVNWANLKNKKIPPPFVPHIANELDTSNFDPEFTNASTSAINRQLMMGTTPLSQAVQENFKGFTYVDDSIMFDHFSSNFSASVRRGSYKPQYGSFIPGNPNLPPAEEVVDEQSEIEEEEEEIDDMDVDEEFINGQFDL
ncbi:serine/threonine protein kinase [Martiniozyma asiatica (nom. inval.)]|nr:serine/threonine protein kinase [Martiniozyma asiatica]